MNKVAVITGANGGIGSAVSQELLARGYKIVLVDLDILITAKEGIDGSNKKA